MTDILTPQQLRDARAAAVEGLAEAAIARIYTELVSRWTSGSVLIDLQYGEDDLASRIAPAFQAKGWWIEFLPAGDTASGSPAQVKITDSGIPVPEDP